MPTAPESLTTDRLTVRALDAADAPFVLELLNEPAFIRNIRDSQVRTIGNAERYIADGPAASYARHGFGLMRVALKATDEPVGMCGLLKRDTLEHPDIGFALLERFSGQGYATEAAQAVMHHARQGLGLKTVAAITAPHNEASGRVLEKVGLRYVGIINPTGAQESRYYEWPCEGRTKRRVPGLPPETPTQSAPVGEVPPKAGKGAAL